jgi:hypothetical protein
MKATPAQSSRAGVIGLVLIGSALLVGARPSQAGGPQQNGAGTRAYIDPHTGKLAVPPPGAATLPSAATAGRRRTADFAEVPSTGSAGGVMINTKGRAAADAVATTDATGKTTARCDSHRPDQFSGPGCSPK